MIASNVRALRRFRRGAALSFGVLALCAAALCVSTAVSAQTQTQAQAQPEPAAGFEPKPLGVANRYMIVAANPLAAQAGRAILAAGGSAVDAAIAAQLALNVVEPQSSGLGGGAFALYWDPANSRLTSWDGRETAPRGARPDMFLGSGGAPMKFPDAVASGNSVGVPGLVRMLAKMHAQGGRLPWVRLFQDAIRLAEDGFEVSPRLASLIAAEADRLKRDPLARALFFDGAGAPLAAGALLRNPALGATLRTVATHGPDAFYSGEIADAIIEAVTADPAPGAMDRGDLTAYAAIERAPLCMVYRERYQVCGMGPPSSGGVGVGQILGLLDHFPIPELNPTDPLAAHLFLEASRLAYADRAAYLADADQVSVPAKGLLDRAYLTGRAQGVDPELATRREVKAGNPPWQEGRVLYAPDLGQGAPGTTQITVVDAEGAVLSMTSSIETAFGSARMAAGFLLNNQLTDFSFEPTRNGRPVANAVAPGKRPRSSMAPTLVFDLTSGGRRPVLALGSPGGSRIIEYVAWAIVCALDWNMPPDQAAAAAHLSQRNRPTTEVEARPDADAVATALAAMGHAVERKEMTSGLNIIAIDGVGRLTGGSDPRREGVALGE